jgi:hypothetical protein
VTIKSIRIFGIVFLALNLGFVGDVAVVTVVSESGRCLHNIRGEEEVIIAKRTFYLGLSMGFGLVNDF